MQLPFDRWSRRALLAPLALLLVAGCPSPPAQGESSAGLGTVDAAPPAQSATAPEAPPAPGESPSALLVPSAAPAAASTGAPAATAGNDGGAIPRKLGPEHARGVCKHRTRLSTPAGEVNCSPYRCRDGKCLLACKTPKDCAGSQGPADFAENGWPLDCVLGKCVPLPPERLSPHG